jgi:hypothetical protein
MDVVCSLRIDDSELRAAIEKDAAEARKPATDGGVLITDSERDAMEMKAAKAYASIGVAMVAELKGTPCAPLAALSPPAVIRMSAVVQARTLVDSVIGPRPKRVSI